MCLAIIMVVFAFSAGPNETLPVRPVGFGPSTMQEGPKKTTLLLGSGAFFSAFTCLINFRHFNELRAFPSRVVVAFVVGARSTEKAIRNFLLFVL